MLTKGEKISIANKGKAPWNKGKTFVNADPIECAYLYQVKNLCIEDIAKRFKCYYRTIRERLKSCGVTVKNTKERLNTTKNRFHKIVDNEKVFDLYTKQGYGATEIAKIFNCDPCVIKHRLRYLGVEIRGRKEAANIERCKGKQQQCDRKGWKLSEPRSKEYCEIFRQLSIARWKDPKMRKRMLEGAQKGLKRARTESTKLEQEVMQIVPENVKFTGNGKFWISIKDGRYKNRNPDFIVNPFKKTKKVIEVLGGYYHEPKHTKELWWDHEQRIIDEYASSGVQCFCLWYFDLLEKINKDVITQKLEEFVNGS